MLEKYSLTLILTIKINESYCQFNVKEKYKQATNPKKSISSNIFNLSFVFYLFTEINEFRKLYSTRNN